MRAIFISYRREDAEGQAGRLFDDLTRHFGQDTVFMDVAGLEPGRDFRRAIDQHVASCGVLLAMIGKSWIDAKDDAGQRRLDDAGDFVRLETASALKRDIPVIPVLVHGAQMPRVDQLPPDLAELAYRNGVEVTHARWDSDVQLLIRALTPYVEASQKDAARASSESPDRPATMASARDASTSAEPVTAAASAPSGRWSLGMVSVGAAALIAIAVGGFAWYQRSAHGPEAIGQVAPVGSPAGAQEKTAAQPEVQSRVDPKSANDSTSPTSAPPSKRQPPREFSLVGNWSGNAGCAVVFSKDDGKNIEGSCDIAGFLHKVTGSYDNATNISITITRIDPSGCATNVAGKIKVISRDYIEMGSDGWNGCGVKTGSVKTLLSR